MTMKTRKNLNIKKTIILRKKERVVKPKRKSFDTYYENLNNCRVTIFGQFWHDSFQNCPNIVTKRSPRVM